MEAWEDSMGFGAIRYLTLESGEKNFTLSAQMTRDAPQISTILKKRKETAS